MKKSDQTGFEIEKIALVSKTEEEIKKCEIDENLSELDRAKLLLSKKNPTQQIAVLLNLPVLFKDHDIKSALFNKILVFL